MKPATIVAPLMAALALFGTAAAQSPTTTPSPTAASPTPTVTAPPSPTPTSSATASPTATQPTSTPSPTVTASPTPTVEFNWDITREVVFPLTGDDGRRHYVTLSQDTAGVVRVRLSLFSFAAGPYNVVLFDKGDCASVGNNPGDVIGTLGQMELEGEDTLVLVFFNTTLVSLDAGRANSIADQDGTSLAIYRPGSGGSGLRAACGRLGDPPGAPETGSGLAGTDEVSWWPVALAGGVVAASALLVARRANRR